MFRSKIVALLFLTAVSAAGVSHAQTSIPLYTVDYQVQVRWEMWRNGNTYWAVEYETSDPAEAQLVYELFEAALENGSLGQILGGGFDWIPREVRLHSKYNWNLRRAEDLRLTSPSAITNYWD